MSIFSRFKKKTKEKTVTKLAKLMCMMVDDFGDVCGMMERQPFSMVMATLIERYRQEHDLTIGQLRYDIEMEYSKLVSENRKMEGA